jgi:hypothetical protein
MTGLLYRPDADQARARLMTWWNGGDIGRPALQIVAPRLAPAEDIPALPQPAGWTTHYSTRDFGYRVNLARRSCVGVHYLAEALPAVSPDLAPNCLALYLGCQGIEGDDTVWCEPLPVEPEAMRFDYDPHNLYWDFTLRLADEQLRLGQGRFLTAFPDLIEGLDTLAAMRGTERLLLDLMERPGWVRGALRQITDRYFHYYDILYDRVRDDVGGSYFWVWGPGRTAKFQCDFSAMISPAMFREFMLPVLNEMCERVPYSIYHWDGPGVIPHHDALLSIPRLKMIQWTPGAGVEPVDHPRWWPIFHKTVDAGKKLLLIGIADVDSLRALQRAFGPKLKQFMLVFYARTLPQAEEFLDVAGG